MPYTTVREWLRRFFRRAEADLLSAQERRLREAQLESARHFRRHASVKQHRGLTAGELMTSPANHSLGRAPAGRREADEQSAHQAAACVEAGTAFGGGVGGKLIGIVSRCDLLSVFLRPDEDIARAVREMLAQLPQADSGGVTVAVRNGIVTMAGLLGSAEEHDLSSWRGRAGLGH